MAIQLVDKTSSIDDRNKFLISSSRANNNINNNDDYMNANVNVGIYGWRFLLFFLFHMRSKKIMKIVDY